jgi:hypothetical protein
MKKTVFTIACLLLLMTLGLGVNAQNLTVKIKLEKALPDANEFILTWEGGDYKTTYYAVKEILEAEPMVRQQVFLYQQQRISAIVKHPWTFEQLRVLFEARGFQVMDKSNTTAEHR